MTAHPPVILRRPHTRTRYTSDPDAIRYRGTYDHDPHPYLAEPVWLDTLGRVNGRGTHLWLRYGCAYVGCRYVLLVRAEHAHDLALRDHSLSNADRAVQRFRDNMAMAVVVPWSERRFQYTVKDVGPAIGQALTPALAGEATLVHLTMTGASDD